MHAFGENPWDIRLTDGQLLDSNDLLLTIRDNALIALD